MPKLKRKRDEDGPDAASASTPAPSSFSTGTARSPPAGSRLSRYDLALSDSTTRPLSSLAGEHHASAASEIGQFSPMINYLVEFLHQPQITERPIDKHARVTYVGTEISNTNFLLRQQFGHESRRESVSHYATNRLNRRLLCHELDRIAPEAFQLPSKHVVDELLAAYFAHVNPIFPVVDKALFMTQYRARDPQNPPSLLLLQAMLVAGAHILYDQPERQSQKAVFFRRAKTLFDARFERNRDTVVQAALLLSWHTDGAEDVVANAWLWIGVAARTAVGLGMHRNADKSTLVSHTKRMWRRVWWLLFQCDVMVSLQYGRPQSLSLDDADVDFPSASDFEGCGHVEIEQYVQATELCKIISRGMKDLSSPSSSRASRSQRESMQRTDDDLAAWSLQYQAMPSSKAAASWSVSTGMLYALYNTALLLFHRRHPAQVDEFSEGSQQDEKAICVSAAITIQHVFDSLREREEMKSIWISGVHCLFTALIQLSSQVKSTNIVLAISAFKQYESALLSLRSLAEYWPNALSIVHFFEDYFRTKQSRSSSPDPGASPSLGREVSPLDRDSRDKALWPRRSSAFTSPSHELADNDHGGRDATELGDCSQEHTEIASSTLVNLYTGAGNEQSDRDQDVQNILDAWQEWQRASQCADDLLFTF